MTIRQQLFRLTHWETWDYRIKLIPLLPIWFWHCLRSRSPWFFTPSNPTLTFGGFEGEGKREMYEQLPPDLYPKSMYISPDADFSEVAQQVTATFGEYPVAVKPNVGMMGLLFRIIHSPDDLRQYHEQVGVDYIVQALITYPIEVSVFYYRMPGAERGTITGFVRKDELAVVGNGRDTLWTLIQAYAPVRYRLPEMQAKHANRLDMVVPAGELYALSHALNQTRGGQLVSLAHEKDEQLLALFDRLSHYTGQFYFGRYDIKTTSVADLKAGRNFSILEFNGAGAAPHHVYGNGHSLWQAYDIVLHHWAMLAKISRENHRRGVPYWGFRQGWKQLKDAQIHLQHLKRMDLTLLVEPDVVGAVV
ncbi:hypothetical protein J2I47_17520 [Fibrella sp. HMF5335]|uniref:ATP-grasp domain-containing protein n=1 Tax=Fibrella rubiginis TaxID=2817060 RepID=A0A939GK99_9BACT|nr:hypothetical protein [Fibrella rubiginis]MBO0938355.1 hypothetical protein [Fibrella rubiginis]